MSVPNNRIYRPAAETIPETLEPPSLRDNSTDSLACTNERLEETLDPFPTEDLPPIIARFVREVHRVQPVSEELGGACAIGVLAAALGRGLELQRGGDKRTRGNLYVMAVSPSGIGKSDVLKPFTAPLNEMEIERQGEWERQTAPRLRSERRILTKEIEKLERSVLKPTEGLNREATVDAMTQKESDLQRVNDQLEPPCCLVDDITTEKFALLLSKNDETLASISADARKSIDNVLGRNLKGRNTDEDMYLKGYSGDRCRVDRISRESISLTSPCISILWLVQPDKFDQLASNEAIKESGFLPRFLICYVKTEPRFLTEGHEEGIASDVLVAYHALIRSLLNTYRFASQPRMLDAVPEARNALRTHYNSVIERRRSGELGDIDSCACRWTEQAWRLTVGLHAGLHGPDAVNQRVTLVTVQSAIRLADWFARQQLELMEVSRTAAKREVKNKIRCALLDNPAGVSQRTLCRSLRLPVSFVETLLSQLMSGGEIEALEDRPAQGGHRRCLYKLKTSRG